MEDRILVTGAGGQLGAYVLQTLERRAISAIAWGGSQAGGVLFGTPIQAVNLADRARVASAFRDARPSVVIHAAALSRIDACFRDPIGAERVNHRATELLADLCRESGSRLVYVSTDLVFDGKRGGYCERDNPAPLSVYGKTKAAGEASVLGYGGGSVVRSSLLFGPSLTGRPSFFASQVQSLLNRVPMSLFADEWRTPLGLCAAARSLVAIAQSDFTGLLHLGGPERMSRWEMGARLAAIMKLDDSVLSKSSQADVPAPEPRPQDVSLDCGLFRHDFPREPWPDWEQSIAEMGVLPPAP